MKDPVVTWALALACLLGLLTGVRGTEGERAAYRFGLVARNLGGEDPVVWYAVLPDAAGAGGRALFVPVPRDGGEARRMAALREDLVARGGIPVSAAVWEVAPVVPPWATLLTSIFVHAGWMHLVSNVLFLLLAGPLLERRLGWWRFGLLFLLAGVLAGLVQVAFDQQAVAPVVGASGAISGLLGALLVLAPRADIRVGLPFTTAGRAWNLPAPALVGFWAGLQIGLLLFTSGSGLPVHLGGFAYGLAFGWLLSLVPARQPASVS